MLTAAALAASVMSCNRDQVVPSAPIRRYARPTRSWPPWPKRWPIPWAPKPPTRQLLKAEALKQFDGDYDVLYRAFAPASKPAFGQAYG
ncbi:MAG: hypothetical protein WKG07_26250 [Hymenobacter sp.]